MKDGVKMNFILLAALHPASYSLSKDDNSRLPIKTNAFSSPIASSLHLSLVVGCEWWDRSMEFLPHSHTLEDEEILLNLLMGWLYMWSDGFPSSVIWYLSNASSYSYWSDQSQTYLVLHIVTHRSCQKQRNSILGTKKESNGKYLFLDSPASILTSFFNGNSMFWLGINKKMRNSLICRKVFFWLNLENPVETLIHVCGF